MGNPFRIHLPLSTIASGTMQPFPPSVWKEGACGSLGVASNAPPRSRPRRRRMRDALLRDPALHVSTPFSLLPCESAHGPGVSLPFSISVDVRGRIGRERVQ